MGHLVNPTSFRLGFCKYWSSRWTIISAKQKYHLLLRSDWNLFKFLVRIFRLKHFIKRSFIFSHYLVVRLPKKLYIFVYFWDGFTLQNHASWLSEFHRIFFHKKFFSKLSFFLNFFHKKYRAMFYLKKIAFLKKKFVSIKSFFSINRNNFFFLFIEALTSFFKIDLNFHLQNKKQVFNHLLNVFFYINYFYKNIELIFFIKFVKKHFVLKSFHDLFFFKLSHFFSRDNYERLMSLLNYLFSPILFSFILKKKTYVLLEKIINDFFRKFILDIQLFCDSTIILSPLPGLAVNSFYVGRYLAIRMQQRYRLMQALGPVFQDLKSNEMILGYRIACSGRFTKKEIASYEKFFSGSVPLSTVNKFVDYFSMPFILKYSTCCFKVWIHYDKRMEELNLGPFHEFFLEKGFFFSTIKKKNY